SSSGSVGGGGGGGTSNENYPNIEIKEKYDLHIFKDKVTSYTFTNRSNPVVHVNITGNLSAGEVTTSVEVLRNTSSLVKTPAPGSVYKNVNIWVGTSGFTNSKNIKEGVVAFRVLNSWLESNSLAGGEIKLVKWDGGSWVQLETSQRNRDSTYTYFEAKTITFGNLAITGLKGEAASTAKPDIETTEKPSVTQTIADKKNGIPGFELVLAASALSAIYMFCRKRR
ncbi:MAG: PGF-pre-PGF domain-containing protein, partial [Candidatus Methanoperedens sp.]|nr:PGF-pre-PGF domain-containing protein [Candidatus Methanoperedens sp.]